MKRSILHAQPVGGDESGASGWLVTLECGHKKATRAKAVSYDCGACGPAAPEEPAPRTATNGALSRALVLARQATLFDSRRAQMDDSIQETVDSLGVYGPSHDHWSISWSGGKDSTCLVTLVVWLLLSGKVKAPKTLTVLYADTRMELLPLWLAAKTIREELEEQAPALAALGCDLRVIEVVAPIERRFFPYMLGRGVPPPNNTTLRWCTEKLKVEPMEHALTWLAVDLGLGELAWRGKGANRKLAYQGKGPQKLLVLTGVRKGESAQRDDRINLSCGKGDGECGQGWYQGALPDALCDKLAPILGWRICHVWEWLDGWAPLVEFGEWSTKLLAEAYGGRDGDEAAEVAARTGCTRCALVVEDTAHENLVKRPRWAYLAELRELSDLYLDLRSPLVRLRMPGGEKRKVGTLSVNQDRMGPISIEHRRAALARVLDIQARVNAKADAQKMPRVDLINDEELAFILASLDAGQFPNKWSGDEPMATELHDLHYADGSVQPLLPGLAPSKARDLGLEGP